MTNATKTGKDDTFYIFPYDALGVGDVSRITIVDTHLGERTAYIIGRNYHLASKSEVEQAGGLEAFFVKGDWRPTQEEDMEIGEIRGLSKEDEEASRKNSGFIPIGKIIIS